MRKKDAQKGKDVWLNLKKIKIDTLNSLFLVNTVILKSSSIRSQT